PHIISLSCHARSRYLFSYLLLFFSNVPAPPEIYTLSLHDALPICATWSCPPMAAGWPESVRRSASPPAASLADRHAASAGTATLDRKSTRLNSSHVKISYAVFCLKKKK